MDGVDLEMKTFERGTETTDREGLDIATDGIDETTNIILPNPPGGDSTDALRKKIEIQQSPLYKKVEEFSKYLRENGYSVTPNLEDFEYKPDKGGTMQLYFNKPGGKEIPLLRAKQGGFRVMSAIDRDLGMGGRTHLKMESINNLPEKLATIDKPHSNR